MKLLLATDAWSPQINGVVVTLTNTIDWLHRLGHAIQVIEPGQFQSVACPTYPEIRLAVAPARRVTAVIDAFAPDAIHIATEGPIGLATRRYCLARGLPFTTAYHTQFPRYVRARIALPVAFTYRWLRWFHGPATGVMAATHSIQQELEAWGFHNVVRWGRGVDAELFRPGADFVGDRNEPVFMYIGRVSIEKNLDAFLKLDLPGIKVVVGDGPDRSRLQRQYRRAVFVGAKTGEPLAAFYRLADVFVFPSLTDTFGLVMAEAMACGTPVAAYPVTGPCDVVTDRRAGVLDTDLRRACMHALSLDRRDVARFGQTFSWERATREFLAHAVRSALPSADLYRVAVNE